MIARSQMRAVVISSVCPSNVSQTLGQRADVEIASDGMSGSKKVVDNGGELECMILSHAL